MIYDEYPDRMALYRLGEDIYDKIRREEEQADEGRAAVERELAAGASARKKDGEETQARVPDGEEAAPEEAAVVSETAAVIPGPQQMQITSRREEEWNHRRDLIQVLLFTKYSAEDTEEETGSGAHPMAVFQLLEEITDFINSSCAFQTKELK